MAKPSKSPGYLVYVTGPKVKTVMPVDAPTSATARREAKKEVREQLGSIDKLKFSARRIKGEGNGNNGGNGDNHSGK